MKIGEAAKKLGVSVKTLQRWDDDGVLVALRNPKNQRYYTEEQIEKVMSKSNDWDVYRLFHADLLVDICGKSESDWVHATENEDQNLYKMIGEHITYKVSDEKEVAELLGIDEQILKRRSIDIKRYIGYFDGGEYIEILNMQIGKDKCIDYLCDNLNIYFDKIDKAIKSNKEDELDNVISGIIEEVLVIVVKDEVEQCIKELKRQSKNGKFEWK